MTTQRAQSAASFFDAQADGAIDEHDDIPDGELVDEWFVGRDEVVGVSCAIAADEADRLAVAQVVLSAGDLAKANLRAGEIDEDADRAAEILLTWRMRATTWDCSPGPAWAMLRRKTSTPASGELGELRLFAAGGADGGDDFGACFERGRGAVVDLDILLIAYTGAEGGEQRAEVSAKFPSGQSLRSRSRNAECGVDSDNAISVQSTKHKVPNAELTWGLMDRLSELPTSRSPRLRRIAISMGCVAVGVIGGLMIFVFTTVRRPPPSMRAADLEIAVARWRGQSPGELRNGGRGIGPTAR